MLTCPRLQIDDIRLEKCQLHALDTESGIYPQVEKAVDVQVWCRTLRRGAIMLVFRQVVGVHDVSLHFSDR